MTIKLRRKVFLVLLLVCGLILAGGAWAEKRYVSGLTSVTLRVQPGNKKKIVEMLPIATMVEVVEPGTDWSLVVSANGNRGYVLTRFLTDQTPPSLALARLQEKYDQMMSQMSEPAKEIARLQEQNQQLTTDLEETRSTLTALKGDYEKLQAGAQDYLKIKTKLNAAQKELAEKTSRNQHLTEEVSRLQIHGNIRWFLTGAGVLLLGIIIGAVAKRRRRRSSLM